MIRSFTIALFAAPFLFCVSAGHAKTAEEQVAFIVAGLEDGSQSANSTAKLISVSPAVFALTGKEGWFEQVTFRSEPERPCIYTMFYSTPDQPDTRNLETRLDFSKVTGFRVAENNGGLRRFFEAKEGFCFDLSMERDCPQGFSNVFARTSNPLPLNATAERMNAAFVQFRKSICTAGAP